MVANTVKIFKYLQDLKQPRRSTLYILALEGVISILIRRLPTSISYFTGSLRPAIPLTLTRKLTSNQILVNMPSQKHALTPEQLALSEERKRRKAEKVAKELEAKDSGPQSSLILPRKWLASSEWNSSTFSSDKQTTIMTWNVS